MDDDRLSTLLELEREGWDSLCDATGGAFYGDMMTDDGLMMLAHGMRMDRDEVVASLDQAPAWQAYEITDERLVDLGADAAALSYTGTAHREGEPPFVALMCSTYVRVEGRWRLALYQQTPVSA